ncbi:hypothetical protein DVR12_19995 [Chitinophaga silvatica]|uniref:YD repeat-containing protein n=2 Tax=Chitinophaga silvatica TaxID=2282649 RepID=A0A3E1Y5J0_9BACT|nr:hypothetical protein DVR12_19995 [Chitinophaga silvatica]
MNPSLDNITPPSPNVSSLLKFGNIPVGPSTGIPQVTIPIYNFESKASGLKLDVSLDYHAGGVKVGEIGSNIGIGWTLNAGGVVSRTMRGLPDEVDLGYINCPVVPTQLFEGNLPRAEEDRPFTKVFYNTLDAQPDIFRFNVNGRSGSFMYGKNRDFLMLEMQKIKVEKFAQSIPMYSADSSITKFVLTDENGVKYFFESYEITSNYALQLTRGRDYVSSWFLTKQLSPNNVDSILYTYEDYSTPTYVAGKSQTIIEGVVDNGGGSHRETNTDQVLSLKGKRIKTIVLPNGVNLTFDYRTENKPDLVIYFLLDKITITGNNNKRGFYLTQDYSLNRATLKKVTPFNGSTEIKMPPYQFEYDRPLPDRLSKEIDHWGFFTNRSTVVGLIPYELFPEKLTTFYELPGYNRDTDSVGVLAGSLKKIIYPTGGSTVFQMEPNKAYSNWLDQKFTTTVPGPDKVNKNTSAYVETGHPYKSDFATISYDGLLNTMTNFKVSAPTSGSCTSGCKLVLEVYTPTGSLLMSKDFPYSNTDGIFGTFSITNMVKGDYKFVFYTSGLTGFATYVGVEWVETIMPNPVSVVYAHKQPFVGGLRVRKIADYTVDNGTPIAEREYEYLTADGNKSSGSLGITPKYSFSAYYFYRITIGAPPGGDQYADIGVHNYIVRSSNTINDLTYTNGSPVTYSRVVEKQKNNGRVERYFTSFEEGGAIVTQSAPYIPADYKPWEYGLLTKELVYDNNNTLVKKTENDYQLLEDKYFLDPVRFQNFKGISILPVKYYFLVDFNVTYDYWKYATRPIYFLSKEFYPPAGRTNLIKTAVFNYDKLGNYVRKETNSIYDINNYYLSSTWSLNSLKDTIRTTYKYTPDLVSVGADSAIYKGMLQKNIINIPLEQTHFINNRQVGFNKSNYHTPFSGLYLTKNVQVKKGNEAIETRISYSKYNNRGRNLSMYKDDGPIVSYKWGYNSQYVIAECKNAEADEFYYEGFEETGVNGNSRTGTRSFSGTFTTADKLTPGLRGKTYKISYWYYTAGTWKFSGELSYTGQTLSGTIDDVRIYPESAELTTYTFDPLVGVTSVSDVRDMPTYYEYDIAGRLRSVKDKDGKILKLYDYQYLQPITQ